MSSQQPVPEGKDPQLWQIAQERASFKKHFTTYIIMSIFFWMIWFISGGQNYNSGLPWPIWPMIGWGIGVAFHYFNAYQNNRNSSIEKEYQKLTNQLKNH